MGSGASKTPARPRREDGNRSSSSDPEATQTTAKSEAQARSQQQRNHAARSDHFGNTDNRPGGLQHAKLDSESDGTTGRGIPNNEAADMNAKSEAKDNDHASPKIDRSALDDADEKDDGVDPFNDCASQDGCGNGDLNSSQGSNMSFESGRNLLNMIGEKIDKKAVQKAELNTFLSQPEKVANNAAPLNTKAFNEALDEIDSIMEQQQEADRKLETKRQKPVFMFDAKKFKEANDKKAAIEELDFRIESGGSLGRNRKRMDDSEDAYRDGVDFGDMEREAFEVEDGTYGDGDTLSQLQSNGTPRTPSIDSLDFRLDDMDEDLMNDIEQQGLNQV